LKLSGFDPRGYQPPFISCIVLKITFSFNSFIVLKKLSYSLSNAPAATSSALYEFGETVI
jgi:hypothetical protein